MGEGGHTGGVHIWNFLSTIVPMPKNLRPKPIIGPQKGAAGPQGERCLVSDDDVDDVVCAGTSPLSTISRWICLALTQLIQLA